MILPFVFIQTARSFRNICKNPNTSLTGQNLHDSREYAMESESDCNKFCNRLWYSQDCSWNELRKTCRPVHAANRDFGLPVKSHYTCEKLCQYITYCNHWNFRPGRNPHARFGHCELLRNHRRWVTENGSKCGANVKTPVFPDQP